jgi:hypothetical protein
MNKKVIIFTLVLASFLVLLGLAKSNNFIDLETFSVLVPDGWSAERSESNSVILTMDKTPNKEAAITISCRPMHSQTTLDDAWNKIKSIIIKGQVLLKEDEDIFFNAKWKRVEIQQSVCNEKIRKIICFTIKDGNKWLIQFDSPINDQKNNLEIFERVKHSLKIK